MYSICTFCYGKKYEPILEKWRERIQNRCENVDAIHVIRECTIPLKFGFRYAWWDVVRLRKLLDLLDKKPMVHIDLDIVVEKDIQSLVDLSYDVIVSKEIGGNEAFPNECSRVLGWGLCTGFYIVKPSAKQWMTKIWERMMQNKETYSDQVNLMEYIVQHPNAKKREECFGIYRNQIIEIKLSKSTTSPFAFSTLTSWYAILFSI
jgi:hypothetical protein